MENVPMILGSGGIPLVWLIMGGFILLGWLVSSSLKRKFAKYSQIPVNNGLTGRDIVEKMLRDSDIRDVEITCIDGKLTDHYNPLTKSINLSRDVYYGSNVAAAAVAAHEAGHAIQHAYGYLWLQMRSTLVPMVSASSRWMMWIIIAGVMLLQTFPTLLLIGIILFGITTLFSFVTLPVEIDASRRALAWLSVNNITTPANHPMAESALRSAAWTYVVAALASLTALIWYIMIYLRR